MIIFIIIFDFMKILGLLRFHNPSQTIISNFIKQCDDQHMSNVASKASHVLRDVLHSTGLGDIKD